MRIGVDPAKIFAGKSGWPRYVGDVDEARNRAFPSCGQAHDTSNIRPADGVGGAQTRMAWRTSSASSPSRLSACGGGRFGDHLHISASLEQTPSPAPVLWIPH